MYVWVGSYLSWSDLDVEVVPLVRNLEYFGPSKTIYPKSVFVNQESVGAHTKHDVYTLRILKQSHSNGHKIYFIVSYSLISVKHLYMLPVSANEIVLYPN